MSRGLLLIAISLLLCLLNACAGGGSFPPPVPGPKLIAITIDPVNSSVALGTSQQLAATCEYSGNTIQDCTPNVSWASSNAAVASVSTQGLTNGVGVGITTITATLDGVMGSSAFAVTNSGLKSITVQPDPVVAKGTAVQLAAIGKFSDGTVENLTNQVTWTSGNSAIVQISPGLATAVGVGSTSVTVSFNGIQGSTSVTVTDATLIALTVTPPNAVIANGTTVQLNTTAIFSDKTAEDVTNQVNWSSGNSSVAQVSNGLATGLSVGSTSVIATLNGVQGTAEITVSAANLTAITITPPNFSIANSTGEKLVATCNFSDGMTQNCTTQVSWASSNDAIAQESDLPATMGLATGVGVGNTSLIATLSGMQGTAAITVTPATLTSITITPPKLSLANGSAVQATATGNFSDGTTEDLTAEVSWTEDNDAIAEASDVTRTKGLVTGLGVGSTSITATLNGVQGTAPIAVTPAALTAITITPPNPSLANGTMMQLTATGNFSDGTTEDLTAEVSWTEAGDAIAEASNVLGSKGQVTGLAVGNTAITAAFNGVQGSATVTVTPAVLTSITITPPILSLANGTTQRLTATCNLSDGTTEDCTEEVSWTSASNPTTQVSDAPGTQGLVTALAVGKTSIVATLSGIQGTAAINITAPTLTSLTITPPNPSIAEGTSVQPTATGNFSDGTTEDLTAQVSWTSGNNSIAQVSDASGTKGLATGLGVGSTTIVATLEGIVGSTTITVTEEVLTSITISPPQASIANGTTIQATATGNFSDGTTEDLTAQVSWTSGNNAIAQVSNASETTGLITGLAVGSTPIIATLEGIHGSASINVTLPVLTTLTVTPPNPSLAAGTSVQLRATGIFSDQSSQDLTSEVSWTSASNSTAQVSDALATEGLVTGLAVGNTSIMVTLNGIQGSTKVTVTPAVLTAVDISAADPTTETALTIAAGTSQQFFATCDFSDNTDEDCTNEVSWTSANNTIAQVSNALNTEGLVTGLGVGTTSILATLNGIQNSIVLKVTGPILTEITIDPINPSIAKGTGQHLNATCEFSDETTENCTQEVSWTSADNTISQVSDALASKGLATGLGIGSTTITATLNGIHGFATMMVAPPVLTSVVITPANSTINAGSTLQMTATGVFSDNSTQELTKQTEFSTSDPTVIVADNMFQVNGLMNAVAPGSAMISANYGGIVGSTGVTVDAATLSSITITYNGSLSIAKRGTVQLIATCNFSNNTTQDCTSQVDWVSAANNIARPYKAKGTQGVIVGNQAGQTSISAILNGVSSSVTVTVRDVTVTGTRITPRNPTMKVGATLLMTGTVLYSDNTSQDFTMFGSWTSSSTTVAHVLSSQQQGNGQVTALEPGTTNIQFTVCCYFFTSTKVTVIP